MKIKRFLRITSILTMLLAVGCAELPNQRGAWTGVALPVTLFDRGGAAHEAVALHIQDGTKIGDGKLKGWYESPPTEKQRNAFLCSSPVLVEHDLDGKEYLLKLNGYLHHRIHVRGMITSGVPVDRSEKNAILLSKPDPDAFVGLLITSKWRIEDLGLSN